MNVDQFLREQHVPFNALPHPTAYSAQQTAHSLHVPGRNFAKTVLLEADGQPVLAVLPAPSTVSLGRVKSVMGARAVRLMPEERLSEVFDDCELGAMPPFGSQYGVATLVDEPLTDDEYIVFDGNSHQQAISMRYADYAHIEQPQIASISGRR